jgi:hypothetical protein
MEQRGGDTRREDKLADRCKAGWPDDLVPTRALDSAQGRFDPRTGPLVQTNWLCDVSPYYLRPKETNGTPRRPPLLSTATRHYKTLNVCLRNSDGFALLAKANSSKVLLLRIGESCPLSIWRSCASTCCLLRKLSRRMVIRLLRVIIGDSGQVAVTSGISVGGCGWLFYSIVLDLLAGRDKRCRWNASSVNDGG